MFTKEITEEVIEECFANIDAFNDEYNGRAIGKSVRICVGGVDGGGLSTYGKSFAITTSDEYECRDGYLFIHGIHEGHDSGSYRNKRVKSEPMSFVAYESIIAIECEPKIYI